MYVFLELCSQAKIYAGIGILLLLYLTIKNPENSRYDIIMLVVKAAIMIGFTFGINKLCTTGYKYFAWIMAFVPHIIACLFLINYN